MHACVHGVAEWVLAMHALPGLRGYMRCCNAALVAVQSHKEWLMASLLARLAAAVA